MKYVYWMSMDWNIYTQVNQNHFAIVLLWELERAYNTPPIIWKLGFFIHTEYPGSLKLHLGMMVQHHSMRKGEKTVTILKRSIWEIHMYYIITMAIIQFDGILSGVYLWGPVTVTYYPLQSLRPTLHHSMQCSLQNFQLKKFPLLKTFNMIKIYELFCSANLVEIPK